MLSLDSLKTLGIMTSAQPAKELVLSSLGDESGSSDGEGNDADVHLAYTLKYCSPLTSSLLYNDCTYILCFQKVQLANVQ